MTIFITPKGFDHPHIDLIQRNAVKSWKQFGSDVDIVLIGNDSGVSEAAADLGVGYVSEVKRSKWGTPLLSDIFLTGRNFSDSPLLAYVNADIILLPNFMNFSKKILESEKKSFLLVGQRWDLDVQSPVDYSNGWQERMYKDIETRGRRHPAGGSDYFVYPRDCFMTIPDFAIGRSGWDNWMFYEARLKKYKLIDCSDAIDIVHQDHDYAHLPNGQPHYRLPESAENVKLAGGKRNIFTLADCNWKMKKDGSLVKSAMTNTKLKREAEIFPLISLKSNFLGEISYAIFHPKKKYQEIRKSMKKQS